MQSASGAFTAAVTSSDQLVSYKVTVTLPAGVQASYGDLSKSVVSVDIDASITSSNPSDSTLISGYPSAQATVVLSGLLNQNPGVALVEAQSAYWLFNANDPTSPTYRLQRAGLAITIQAGLWDGSTSSELITNFTGTIDMVALSNGSVTLTCRDSMSTVTNQATLPPVVTAAPYNAGLTSQFAIDYLLRHSSPSTYLSWPQLRPNCVLACGFRSSLWPDVGTFQPNAQAGQPVFTQGIWGTALENTSANQGYDPYTPSSPILPSQSVWIEWWGSLGNGGQHVIVSDAVTGWTNVGILFSYVPGGTLQLQIGTLAASVTQNWSIGTTTGNHYMAAEVNWSPLSATVTGTLYFDHTSTPISLTAAGGRPAAVNMTEITVIAGGSTGSMEALQVTTESSGSPRVSFIPTLILDPSLNPLTALPDVTGQTVWQVLQDIAAAEAGVIGFDELGVCHFRNRTTLATSASVRTVTSTQSLLTLDSLEQMSLCATHIQIPVNQLFLTAPETVWSASTAIQCAAGSTVINATTDNPVVNIATTDSGYLPGSPTAGLTYWRACRTADGTGLSVNTGVSVSVVQTGPSALTITVVNRNAFTVFLCNGATFPSYSVPVLWVGGQAVTPAPVNADGSSTGGTVYADAQWPPAWAGGAVTNPLGEILQQLPANAWLQDIDAATLLANDILSDFYQPRPLYRNVSIVADPRLQMGDRVTLQDADVSQVSNDAIVIGLHTTLSATDWTQVIDAQACYAPGDWILDDAVYSVLDVSTYT